MWKIKDSQGCDEPYTHDDRRNHSYGSSDLGAQRLSKKIGSQASELRGATSPVGGRAGKTPILYTDLPSKPIASSQSSSNVPIDDPFYLWPLPSTPPGDEPINDFPRLPDNWVKSRLGVERSPITLQEPNNSNWDVGTTIQTLRPPNSLSPESLIRFFGTPGSHKDSATAVQVPFIPGALSTPQSSSAVFRQD